MVTACLRAGFITRKLLCDSSPILQNLVWVYEVGKDVAYVMILLCNSAILKLLVYFNMSSLHLDMYLHPLISRPDLDSSHKTNAPTVRPDDV